MPNSEGAPINRAKLHYTPDMCQITDSQLDSQADISQGEIVQKALIHLVLRGSTTRGKKKLPLSFPLHFCQPKGESVGFFSDAAYKMELRALLPFG